MLTFSVFFILQMQQQGQRIGCLFVLLKKLSYLLVILLVINVVLSEPLTLILEVISEYVSNFRRCVQILLNSE